jgi:hypothetical protein
VIAAGCSGDATVTHNAFVLQGEEGYSSQSKVFTQDHLAFNGTWEAQTSKAHVYSMEPLLQDVYHVRGMRRPQPRTLEGLSHSNNSSGPREQVAHLGGKETQGGPGRDVTRAFVNMCGGKVGCRVGWA